MATIEQEARNLARWIDTAVTAEHGDTPDRLALYGYAEMNALCTLIRRARRLHRAYEIVCSVEMTPAAFARHDKYTERLEKRVKLWAADLHATGILAVEIQGDPRGSPVKIHVLNRAGKLVRTHGIGLVC